MGETMIDKKQVHKLNKGWTVLMVNENGETKRVKGYRRVIVSSFFICIVSISAAVIMFLLYQHVLEENKQLKETLAISKTLYGVKKEHKQRPKIAKSPFEINPNLYLEHEKHIAPIRKHELTNKRPKLDVHNELFCMPALKTSKERVPSFIRTSKMKVDNFHIIIRPKLNAVSMSFVLRNHKKAKKALSGTSFLILQNDKDDENWLVDPNVPLKKGKPTRYTKGRSFYVARFKTIRHTLYNIENPELFQISHILIYSSNGRLLMDKAYPIEMIL